VAEETFAPGTRLGDYEILAELGGGGMGRVYRARDLTLERIVALKTLAPQFRKDEVLVQRFLKEARAAARLNHPNIVQIYDFGKDGDTYYLAMEYVEGESLAAFLRRGTFTESDAISVTRFTCRALVVAHAEGLVHRDIKPDNLMLTAKGELKLVDLGVAKRVDEDQSLTQTGQALGTPHYISPEQIRASKDIDGRADIYSLGATMYHLVTGKPPFNGSSSAMVMSLHLYQPVEDPRASVPELSEGFAFVLQKMMAKDPNDRYPDADAVDRDLYRLEIGEAPEATAPFDDSAATLVQVSSGNPTPAMAAARSAATTASARPPAASSASISPNTSGVSTNPNLKTLESELAKHVGPLARVLVKRAAKNAASLQQLILELEKEIPGDKPRRAFRSAVERLR
jgi:eukaryotic-like serine/threonine-protein kinase